MSGIKRVYDGSFSVSSVWGTRLDPFSGKKALHNGLDLVGISSKTVISPIDGTVVRSRIVTDASNVTSEWGNYVAVTDGVYIIYMCHLASRAVSEGKAVKAGDVVGIEGSTGKSTGPHLHFEVRRGSGIVDPASFLGIANAVGVVAESLVRPDYASLVADRCGLEERTVKYLSDYEYSADLWRKLWQAISRQ